MPVLARASEGTTPSGGLASLLDFALDLTGVLLVPSISLSTSSSSYDENKSHRGRVQCTTFPNGYLVDSSLFGRRIYHP